MARGPIGVEWPLVGRVEELALLRELRSSTPAASAVISGPAGVGKSRLARAAAAEAEVEGWAALSIRGSAGYSAVPLGPLRTILRVTPHSHSLADLTARVEHDLLELRSPRGLLVVADDGQDLDEASAGLLHQLAGNGSIVTIITARSDKTLPAALIALWKDGIAERVGLQNLSLDETAALLSESLGAHLQDSSANRIWQVTEGNPLYLREVVLSSIEAGALKQVQGEWRWRGEWATADRLQEIVAARLGRLEPEESTVMEMLALTGSLPLDLVAGLTTTRTVERLERRGLLTTEQNAERVEVAIAHPLHAEVLRSKMPALQQRAIRRTLVEALTKQSGRRIEDQVRIACWSIESGLEVDPMTLAPGTDASLFGGIGQAIAARLIEVLPNAAIAMPPTGSVVRQDAERAVRLAQLAYERSGGVAEGAALASALGWIGSVDRAEMVLAEIAQKAEALDDRLRLAIVLAWVRFWGRWDAEQSMAGLRAALAEAEPTADRSLVEGIYERLAGTALNTGDPAAALTFARQAAAAGVELHQSIAAAPAAAALAYLGRCEEAIELADQAVPIAHERGHPLMVAMLLFARTGAQARNGKLEEALALITWLRDVALEGEILEATASFGVLLGETLLRQGRPASAARILRDSASLLVESDILGYRSWALSGLARAEVQTGHVDAAASALEEARHVHPIVRHFDLSLFLAESELHRVNGRADDAISAARAAATWARSCGMVVDEAVALDTLLRLCPSREIVERLTELAESTDSELVAVLRDHAGALVAADPDRLLETSDRFATMTAWWMATEAAAAAAKILDRRNQSRAAKAALRKASGFAANCEGARTSLSDLGSGPVRLTKREREVAQLAASGASNREIAEKMCVSLRTVENHLYNAYAKLGVTDRGSLVAALDGPSL